MARITIEVSEKGIKEAEKELKKLGKTGVETEEKAKKLGSTFDANSKKLAFVAKGAAVASTAILAVGVAVGSVAISTAKYNVELANQARLSNQTVSDYQASAFAAAQYGISVDKLADSFKDTIERVGEFVGAKGTGALNDFGDVMGYTKKQTLEFAKSVEHLSGQEILVKMVAKMEEAGASSAQVSFALEGMASDMTALIPLLSNGGKELDRLTTSMNAVVAPLSEEDIATFRSLNEASELASASIKSMLTTAILPLVQPMSELALITANYFATINEGTKQNLAITDARAVALVESLNVEVTKQVELINALNEAQSSGGGTGYGDYAKQSKEQIEAQSKLVEIEQRLAEAKEATAAISTRVATEEKAIADTELKTKKELAEAKEKANKLAVEKELKAKEALAVKAKASTDALAEAEAKANADAVERIRQGTLSEEVARLERLEMEKQIINESVLSEQGKFERIQAITMAHDEWKLAQEESSRDKLQRMESLKLRLDKKAAQDQTSLLLQTTGMIASSLDERTTAYKIAATAQTLISTYETAQAAYNGFVEAFPGPYGMIAGGAAAGVATGIGLANVAKINGARMQGGDVTAGTPYNVGERGQETFVPNVSGKIVPNHKIDSMNGQAYQPKVIIENYATQANLTQTQAPNGDVYVKLEDLDGLMAQNAGNPNTEYSQSMNSTYTNLER